MPTRVEAYQLALFSRGMIAKLDRALSTVQHKNDQTQNPHAQWEKGH